MKDKQNNQPNKLVIFQSKKIRRIWHEDEWYYSVVDIVGVLTDSSNPRDYWYKMKIRVEEEAGFELSTDENGGSRWKNESYGLF